ncbi:phosphoribosylanthranilate isomerase [Natrialba swarupiae]|uniref:N-(5'-phosphoribosyl)anthranilate isomerase n=1 Tax=Natrialba swarupiae TaxID=2448032 RepID=A0A5D5AN53_9EURY|nr:phosphoribosylanthranilate isomerase [Natrialba swarupiae]TYT60531.1 phosphoribosylanthranilate isomerase [Natrialba swarupiae]
MIVQIYSLTTVDDVHACSNAGVDHVGVAAGNQDLPASISNEEARTLFEATSDRMRTVALTVETDVDEILDYAEAVDPDILHLCPDVDALTVEQIREINEALPKSMDVMRALDVVDGAVDIAEQLDSVTDWFLLDTATDAVEGIGASGETHDWSISRRIVEATETPVILAGGLSPENVTEAVEAVDPAGVDSYTHTSAGERRKDPEKVRAFTEAARAGSE